MKISFLSSPWRTQSVMNFARMLAEARSGVLNSVYFEDGSVADRFDTAWVAQVGNPEAGEARDFCQELARRSQLM